MKKMIPIPTLRKLSKIMLDMGKAEQNSHEQVDAASTWLENEHECIVNYIVPEGVELTEENYPDFKNELRERVMNFMNGGKFRRNAESNTDVKQENV